MDESEGVDAQPNSCLTVTFNATTLPVLWWPFSSNQWFMGSLEIDGFCGLTIYVGERMETLEMIHCLHSRGDFSWNPLFTQAGLGECVYFLTLWLMQLYIKKISVFQKCYVWNFWVIITLRNVWDLKPEEAPFFHLEFYILLWLLKIFQSYFPIVYLHIYVTVHIRKKYGCCIIREEERFDQIQF